MSANLADIVHQSAEQRPGSVAIIEGERSTTYAGLDSAISACASGLALRGIAPGDRVVLMLGNRTEFAIAYFAVLRAGAVAVPINVSLVADEIEHVLGDVEPRLVITEPGLRTKALEAGGEDLPILTAGSGQWADLISAGRAEPMAQVDVDPESLAVLLFTAGSTGRPKAAMLSHRAMLANLRELEALADPPAMTSSDVVLGVLPLFHVYSLSTVLGLSLAVGATIVLEERFAPRRTLELVKDAGITVIAGAPPMYIAWSAEPDLREMLAGVRMMSSGASPLPPAVFDQFTTVAGKPIWEGYGLTECAPVVATTLASGRPKAGSVGRPIPGVEVMLVDAGGDPAEDGTGEVFIRGASLFSGYWPDGADGPNEDGWWGTGDVAVLDEDGDLRLVDRRKELVLVSGFNVYPREVERVIAEVPGVAEVAVIGVSHPYTGEAVKAFVSTMPGAQVGADEVVAHCQQRLARFKCPTIVEVLPDMPHSAAGKIARGRLREMSGA